MISSSSSSSSSSTWEGYVARMGDIRGLNNIFMGQPDWKRPLERLSNM